MRKSAGLITPRIFPNSSFTIINSPLEDWPDAFQAGPLAVIDGKINESIYSWNESHDGRKVFIGVDATQRNLFVLELYGNDAAGYTAPGTKEFKMKVERFVHGHAILDGMWTDGGTMGKEPGQRKPVTVLGGKLIPQAGPRNERRLNPIDSSNSKRTWILGSVIAALAIGMLIVKVVEPSSSEKEAELRRNGEHSQTIVPAPLEGGPQVTRRAPRQVNVPYDDATLQEIKKVKKDVASQFGMTVDGYPRPFKKFLDEYLGSRYLANPKDPLLLTKDLPTLCEHALKNHPQLIWEPGNRPLPRAGEIVIEENISELEPLRLSNGDIIQTAIPTIYLNYKEIMPLENVPEPGGPRSEMRRKRETLTSASNPEEIVAGGRVASRREFQKAIEGSARTKIVGPQWMRYRKLENAADASRFLKNGKVDILETKQWGGPYISSPSPGFLHPIFADVREKTHLVVELTPSAVEKAGYVGAPGASGEFFLRDVERAWIVKDEESGRIRYQEVRLVGDRMLARAIRYWIQNWKEKITEILDSWRKVLGEDEMNALFEKLKAEGGIPKGITIDAKADAAGGVLIDIRRRTTRDRPVTLLRFKPQWIADPEDKDMQIQVPGQRITRIFAGGGKLYVEYLSSRGAFPGTALQGRGS